MEAPSPTKPGLAQSTTINDIFTPLENALLKACSEALDFVRLYKDGVQGNSKVKPKPEKAKERLEDYKKYMQILTDLRRRRAEVAEAIIKNKDPEIVVAPSPPPIFRWEVFDESLEYEGNPDIPNDRIFVVVHRLIVHHDGNNLKKRTLAVKYDLGIPRDAGIVGSTDSVGMTDIPNDKIPPSLPSVKHQYLFEDKKDFSLRRAKSVAMLASRKSAVFEVHSLPGFFLSGSTYGYAFVPLKDLCNKCGINNIIVPLMESNNPTMRTNRCVGASLEVSILIPKPLETDKEIRITKENRLIIDQAWSDAPVMLLPKSMMKSVPPARPKSTEIKQTSLPAPVVASNVPLKASEGPVTAKVDNSTKPVSKKVNDAFSLGFDVDLNHEDMEMNMDVDLNDIDDSDLAELGLHDNDDDLEGLYADLHDDNCMIDELEKLTPPLPIAPAVKPVVAAPPAPIAKSSAVKPVSVTAAPAAANPGPIELTELEMKDPLGIQFIESSDVMDAELELATSKLSTASADDKYYLTLRINLINTKMSVLITKVQKGELSMEAYLARLKDRMARDKKMAVYFNGLASKNDEDAPKNKDIALQIMRRIMTMKKEIEGAESNSA